MDPSLFDDRHRPKIFFSAGVIRQPGVAAGHFNIAVTQQLLQAF